MVEFKEIKAKSILTRHKYRDDWFWNRYSINPYRGCQFACNYCDAITEKYLVHDRYEDFSRIIYVKTNAPERLEKELQRIRLDVVALSGVTDPYQPAEKKYELTRRILKVLADNSFAVHIVTKSDLVLRDVDLLKEIAKKSWCTVSVTIITFDPKLTPLLEPFAPSPERRLEAVRSLNEAGVQAGVDFTPMVPYIVDDENNIEDVIKQASDNGEYILIGASMTLRSNQRIRFMELLRKHWPHLIEKYKKLYGNAEEPKREHDIKLNKKAFYLCKNYSIRNYIPPPTFDNENFRVATLLLLIAFFKEMKTANPYAAWAYHKVAETIENLDENIRDVHERGELRKIPGVGASIARSIKEFLETGKCEKLELEKKLW